MENVCSGLLGLVLFLFGFEWIAGDWRRVAVVG